MLSVNDLLVPEALGSRIELVETRPYFLYDAQNNRTDKVEGFKYYVLLKDRRQEKVAVKIAGELQMEADDKGDGIPVKLEGVKIRAYSFNRQMNFTITADAIKAI